MLPLVLPLVLPWIGALALSTAALPGSMQLHTHCPSYGLHLDRAPLSSPGICVLLGVLVVALHDALADARSVRPRYGQFQPSLTHSPSAPRRPTNQQRASISCWLPPLVSVQASERVLVTCCKPEVPEVSQRWTKLTMLGMKTSWHLRCTFQSFCTVL